MAERRPSIVQTAVSSLRNNADKMTRDLEEKFGRSIYHQQLTARLQEALVNASLAIFDPNQDIEYRVVETIALVNFRMTGLQGRERPDLADIFGIWMEIVTQEWLPLLQARRVIERRFDLMGIPRRGPDRLNVKDIVTSYGERDVILWGFRLLVNTFGSEAEIPMFVLSVQSMMMGQGSDLRFAGGDED